MRQALNVNFPSFMRPGETRQFRGDEQLHNRVAGKTLRSPSRARRSNSPG